MRKVLLVSLVLVAACGKEAGSWSAVLKQHAAALDALRDRVLAASAALDARPDAKAYPKCQPSADLHFAPLGTAAEHDVDFVDEGLLAQVGVPGFHPARTDMFHFLSDPSTVTYALWWRHDGHGLGPSPKPADRARLAAAEGVKRVVLFRERAESNREAIKLDAFLVDLEPVAVKCAISVEAEGQTVTVEGTPIEHWVETTYRKDTGQVLSVREFDTGGGGGTYTNSAMGLAQQGFEELAKLQLGFAPHHCDDDSDCTWWQDHACRKGACFPDQAKVAARKQAYERAVPIFEATKALYYECERLEQEVKGAADRTPFNACIERYWAAMDAEGKKLGLTREEFGKPHEVWAGQQVKLDGKGTLTCDELVPPAIRDQHGLHFLQETPADPSWGLRVMCAYETKTDSYNAIQVVCGEEGSAAGTVDYWSKDKGHRPVKPLAAGKQGFVGQQDGKPAFALVDDDTPCSVTGNGVADTEAFAQALVAALTPLALSN